MTEDFKNMRTGEDTHEIISPLPSGRAIAKSRNWKVVSSGDDVINVRIPDLKEIKTVINVNLYTNPTTDAHGPILATITGNVVGMTIYDVGAGTTLTAEVIAEGSL